MPNGESKNWIRFQVTLESFHSIYGHWPSVINLYPFFIEELKGNPSSRVTLLSCIVVHGSDRFCFRLMIPEIFWLVICT